MSGFNKGVNLSESEAKNYFDSIFAAADIHDEGLYFDPLRGVDKRVEIGQKLKAKNLIMTKDPSIDSSSGGTFTGYGLLPPFIDPTVVDKTVRITPLVRLLARRAIRGRSYVYNNISAKAGAVFVSEDAALSEQVDTRGTTNLFMKYLAAVGRITDVSTASETIINVQAEEIRTKTDSMNEALEDEIINGNTSTNALGFQGLIQSITTNSNDNSGAETTLQLIRDDINESFEANGLVDLVVTDGNTFNYVKGLLMDFQRNVERPSPEMTFGIPDSFMFDGALFIKDRYMPTSAASRRMLYLDTRFIFLAVLRDYTFQELAKVNLSKKFVISWFGSLAVTFEASSVQRYGLA